MNATVSEGREKRYFPRVDFRSNATLMTTKKKWPVCIIDLSFNGALAALINPHPLIEGEEVILSITTDDGERIKMQGRLAHQRDHFLGIECRATGIDHQSRLRDLLDKYAPPADHHRGVNELDSHASLHHPTKQH